MSKVPGSYKSKAVYKSDVHETPRVKEIPVSLTDSDDELYDYKNQSFPGFMGQDPALARDIGQHIRHHNR